MKIPQKYQYVVINKFFNILSRSVTMITFLDLDKINSEFRYAIIQV